MGKVQGRVARDLTLYVRQLAWLNTAPCPPDGSPAADKAKAKKLTRRDELEKDGIKPRMPPCPAPHIIDRFVEIGITEGGGMGPAPLSWPTITEWQRNTAVKLDPWEAKLMRSLSVAYIAEGARAEEANCPPPWLAEVTGREREADEAALDMVLG